MENKIEEQSLPEWINRIKHLKNRLLWIEDVTTKTEENILDIIKTQEQLTNTIMSLFAKYWIKDDSVNNLWKQINQKLSAIKWLNKKQLLNIKLSKQEMWNAISLVKSFYDKTTKDKLTGLRNEEFTNNLIDILWKERKKFTLVYLDINDLKRANDDYWHDIWDKLILEFSRIINLIFWEKNNYIARIHWDEFNVVSLDSYTDTIKKIDRLKKWLENSHIKTNNGKNINVSAAIWLANTHIDKIESIWSLIRMADKRMYKNKEQIKNNK